MRCPSGKNDELTETFTSYFSGFDGVYVIVENVPCRKCEVCGEEFFTLSVMEKLDEIITRLKSIASKIFIVDYKAAA